MDATVNIVGAGASAEAQSFEAPPVNIDLLIARAIEDYAPANEHWIASFKSLCKQNAEGLTTGSVDIKYCVEKADELVEKGLV